jgi:acetyl esterase/lipase
MAYTKLERLTLFLRLWTVKGFIRALLFFTRKLKPLPQTTKPSFLRSYPVRPGLENRVFIPPNRKAGDALLPLYLDVHGGGWAIFDPETDDPFCSYFSRTFNVLVVSINYHKAPKNAFPGPVEDVAAIIKAVIDDPTLPIDKTRIAMGGFSAGGNLSLTVPQKPELKGLIKAAVAFYAPTDMVPSAEFKLQTRLTPDKPDVLEKIAAPFNWGYVGDEVDRKNPLLSPIYAAREDLPEYIYMIGAEEDMLCLEAKAFAEQVAGLPKDGVGSKAIDGVAADSGWDEGAVRWELVRGQPHSFTHFPKKGSAERERLNATFAVYKRVHAWLKAGPWA